MAVRMVLPPGFRFHPTEEELLAFYLQRRVAGQELHSNVISDVDIYKHDPWDLPNLSCISSRDSEAWYFFHSSDRKYPRGSRTNRATASGYWKATGRDRPIFSGAKALLGTKKTLVFYRGRAPSGQRTHWVMHEFQLTVSTSGLVVCRVVKKKQKQSISIEASGSFELELNASATDKLQIRVSGEEDLKQKQRSPTSLCQLPTISLYAHMVVDDVDGSSNNILQRQTLKCNTVAPDLQINEDDDGGDDVVNDDAAAAESEEDDGPASASV